MAPGSPADNAADQVQRMPSTDASPYAPAKWRGSPNRAVRPGELPMPSGAPLQLGKSKQVQASPPDIQGSSARSSTTDDTLAAPQDLLPATHPTGAASTSPHDLLNTQQPSPVTQSFHSSLLQAAQPADAPQRAASGSCLNPTAGRHIHSPDSPVTTCTTAAAAAAAGEAEHEKQMHSTHDPDTTTTTTAAADAGGVVAAAGAEETDSTQVPDTITTTAAAAAAQEEENASSPVTPVTTTAAKAAAAAAGDRQGCKEPAANKEWQELLRLREEKGLGAVVAAVMAKGKGLYVPATTVIDAKNPLPLEALSESTQRYERLRKESQLWRAHQQHNKEAVNFQPGLPQPLVEAMNAAAATAMAGLPVLRKEPAPDGEGTRLVVVRNNSSSSPCRRQPTMPPSPMAAGASPGASPAVILAVAGDPLSAAADNSSNGLRTMASTTADAASAVGCQEPGDLPAAADSVSKELQTRPAAADNSSKKLQTRPAAAPAAPPAGTASAAGAAAPGGDACTAGRRERRRAPKLQLYQPPARRQEAQQQHQQSLATCQQQHQEGGASRQQEQQEGRRQKEEERRLKGWGPLQDGKQQEGKQQDEGWGPLLDGYHQEALQKHDGWEPHQREGWGQQQQDGWGEPKQRRGWGKNQQQGLGALQAERQGAWSMPQQQPAGGPLMGMSRLALAMPGASPDDMGLMAAGGSNSGEVPLHNTNPPVDGLPVAEPTSGVHPPDATHPATSGPLTATHPAGYVLVSESVLCGILQQLAQAQQLQQLTTFPQSQQLQQPTADQGLQLDWQQLVDLVQQQPQQQQVQESLQVPPGMLVPQQQLPLQQVPGVLVPQQQLPLQQVPGVLVPQQQLPLQQVPGAPLAQEQQQVHGMSPGMPLLPLPMQQHQPQVAGVGVLQQQQLLLPGGVWQEGSAAPVLLAPQYSAGVFDGIFSAEDAAAFGLV